MLFVNRKMNDIIIPIVTFIASLFVVILFIACGWYAVWTLFLKKFKFVRELLGTNGSESEVNERPRRTKSKLRRE